VLKWDRERVAKVEVVAEVAVGRESRESKSRKKELKMTVLALALVIFYGDGSEERLEIILGICGGYIV